MSLLAPLALAGLLATAQDLPGVPGPGDAVTPGDGAIVLPPGPVAAALEALGTRDARPLPSPWPAWSDHGEAGWGGEAAWRRWVELLRAEAPPHPSAPARRAALAQLARAQGRDGDAWVHLLACASEPAVLADLLPQFIPGVAPGAAPDALPDGVLLTPALPPAERPRGGLRWLAGRKLVRTRFRLGEAECSLGVSVDRDGLEVAVHHLAGGPARVRVVPPVPRGIDPGLLFADWEKRKADSGPVEFLLTAEDPEHTLWLTFHPRAERWPEPALDTLAGLAPGRAIRVVSPAGDEPRLRRFAEALGELLGVPASLCPRDAAAPPGLEPLVIHLEPDAAGERKLCELIGLAEAFALAAPLR